MFLIYKHDIFFLFLLRPWFQCCILAEDYWTCRLLCSFRTGLLFRCWRWLIRLVSLLLQCTCMFNNVSNAIYYKLPLDSTNSLNSRHSSFLLVRTCRTSSGFISLSFNILKKLLSMICVNVKRMTK